MKNRTPRRIQINTETYRWRVHHRHNRPGAPTERLCTEVFTAFSEPFPRRPLRILFPETPEHGPGFPRQSGVIVDYAEPTREINLNRPRVARLLIEIATSIGWNPAQMRTEFVIPNGYHLLREHRESLVAALAETAGGAPM